MENITLEQIANDTLTAAKDPFYSNVHKVICDHFALSNASVDMNVFTAVAAITDVIANRAELKIDFSKANDPKDYQKLKAELYMVSSNHNLSYLNRLDAIFCSIGFAITGILACFTFDTSTQKTVIASAASSVFVGASLTIAISIIASFIARRPWSKTFRSTAGNYHVTHARTLYGHLLRKVCGTNCIEQPWSTFSYIDYRALKTAKEMCRRHPELRLKDDEDDTPKANQTVG